MTNFVTKTKIAKIMQVPTYTLIIKQSYCDEISHKNNIHTNPK